LAKSLATGVQRFPVSRAIFGRLQERSEMKKIEAIIVPWKLNALRAELERRGIQVTLILTDVQQAEERETSIASNTEAADSLAGRLKVELIVGDRQAPKTVEVLTQYGQVACLRVHEALQIVPPF
jgi:nitrogen regulatory protein PII